MPVLLISGGTRGIGWGIVRAFAQAGWTISTCYHEDETSARRAQEELAAVTSDFLIQKADVTDTRELTDWIEETRKRFGSLDCVIHNAGSTRNARLVN
ncbi:MAG: SDR family oxidoreductase, partial [bacterium]